MLVTIAFIIAFFFAMNIGGSGAAATMGAAYGSGTLSNKRVALFICAVAIFLGSLSGGEVVKTIGSGIVPTSILKTDLVVIVLAAATISLFAANVLGIPLSTSEITVGAVVGAGIAYQSLYISKLLWIVSFWLITPLVAFSLAFFISKWLKGKTLKQNKWVGFLLIIAGFFEAFSAGMNNVANAVGPLVGAGLLSVHHGIIFGGLFVALGALLLGSRVLETNGKKLRLFPTRRMHYFGNRGNARYRFISFWSPRSAHTNHDISYYRHRHNKKRLFDLAKANCYSSAESMGSLSYFCLSSFI